MYLKSLVAPILQSAWFNEKYKRWSGVTGSFDIDRYSSPLNPFKLIYANPDMIKYKSGRVEDNDNDTPKFQWGGVCSGNWDSPGNEAKITEDWIYRSFKDVFIHGEKWEETIAYNHVLKKIKKNGSAWHGCRSKEDMLNRFEYCESLYNEIETNGYKKQYEIGTHHPMRNLKNEITVDIGRNGNLLLVDGRHRFFIVNLLDIKKIPIAVSVRHPKWMEYRDGVYASALCNKPHPDFDEFSNTASSN